MNFLNEINEDTIIICSNLNKIKILKELDKYNKLFKISFLTLNEFKKRYYFDYNKETIYYLIKTYNIKYDVALTYLNNMIYIENKEYSNSKINFLVSLKNELIENNLLLYDNTFKDFIKSKNIIIYNTYVDKNIQIELNKYKYKVINERNNSTRHDVYEFNNIEDEVSFVAESISKLINNNIDINNIKISNINDEYIPIIERIFSLYNIPYDINKSSSIYDTLVGSYFINNYDDNLNDVINYMKDNYNKDIVNKIINIINDYTFCDDKTLVKDMIIYDLKNTYINRDYLENKVELIDLNSIDDEYVFILSFNQNIIPKIYKDEDYLSNKEKEILNIESSNELNKIEKKNIINILNSSNKLYISFKHSSYLGTFYPSNLINELNMSVLNYEYTYNYSNNYNKLLLTKMLDEYYKYGIYNKNLDKLFNTYNIDYRIYDNKYNKVSFDSLNKRVNGSIKLAYTTLEQYNECAFKYYIKNILKLDIYESTFAAFVGSLFHKVLEVCLNSNMNYNLVIDDYIKNEKFTAKEMFYINKIRSDIKFCLDYLIEVKKFTKLNEYKFENKIEIDKSNKLNVIFKGFIDKMMYCEYKGKKVIALIDYKTNDTDIKTNLLEYGLGLQLPIYLYLARKEYNDCLFAGFYIQKVLPVDNKYDSSISLEQRKKDYLKLTGYSNENEEIIKLFDSSYKDSNMIKGLKVNKDGNFSTRAYTVGNDRMDEICKKIDMVIDNCVHNIEECNFDINPKVYKEVNKACTFCKFKDLCFMTNKDLVEIKEEEEECTGQMSN